MDRLAVFIDAENVRWGARKAFADNSYTDGQVDPFFLSCHLLDKHVAFRRNANQAYDAELVGVHVFKGRPSGEKEPKARRAHDRQCTHWRRKDLVSVDERDLQYPADWQLGQACGLKHCLLRPKEKGVDVALALSLVKGAVMEYDVAILFSADADLKPAMEEVIERNRFLALARWNDGVTTYRPFYLPQPGRNPLRPVVHDLRRADYDFVHDSHDYTEED